VYISPIWGTKTPGRILQSSLRSVIKLLPCLLMFGYYQFMSHSLYCDILYIHDCLVINI